MSPEMMTYLPLILLGLVALVVIVWALSRMNRKAKVLRDDGADPLARDVLEDGAAPAPRNQALIDAPRSVAINQGEISAAANSDAVAAAPAVADAEAGPVITPTVSTPAEADPAAPATAAPAPATAAPATQDDLTRIKGLGPKLAALLSELGVTTFAQIAAWDDAAIARIDAQLGRFSGRITRDQWVEQAKLLAAGDQTGFTAAYGNNG